MSTFERATKTLEIPSGRTIVLYEYATGGERRAARDLYTGDVEVTNFSQKEGGEIEAGVTGMKMSRASIAQDFAIKTFVISIDGRKQGEPVGETGTKTDILKEILDLPVADFELVEGEINKLLDPKKG